MAVSARMDIAADRRRRREGRRPARQIGSHSLGGCATKTFRYVWQLPQNLLGLALSLFLRRRIIERRRDGEQVVYFCFRTQGGISLGRYVFVHREANEYLVRHELGHCRQSLMLGPLFLLIVGLPSIGWAALHTVLWRRWPQLDYFRFYTESWANRLAGLETAGTATDPFDAGEHDGSGA